MSHISSNACFYGTVQEAFGGKENLREAQKGLERLTFDPVSISEPHLPAIKRTVKVPVVTTEDVDWMDESLELEFQDPPPPPAIAWDDEKHDAPVTQDMNKDFPKFERSEYRDGNAKVEDLLTGGPDPLDAKENNKWAGAQKAGKGKELFPEAPPNSQQAITKAIVKEAEEEKEKEDKEDPFHPENAHFKEFLLQDPCPFYNKYTDKWNCPHTNCKLVLAPISIVPANQDQTPIQGLSSLRNPSEERRPLRYQAALSTLSQSVCGCGGTHSTR